MFLMITTMSSFDLKYSTIFLPDEAHAEQRINPKEARLDPRPARTEYSVSAKVGAYYPRYAPRFKRTVIALRVQTKAASTSKKEQGCCGVRVPQNS